MAMATKKCFSNSKIVTIVLPTVVQLSETNIKYATIKKVKPTLFSGNLVHQNVGVQNLWTMEKRNKFAEVYRQERQ